MVYMDILLLWTVIAFLVVLMIGSISFIIKIIPVYIKIIKEVIFK